MLVFSHLPFQGFLQDSTTWYTLLNLKECRVSTYFKAFDESTNYAVERLRWKWKCLLFDSLSSPSVVWALSPAVEASFHGATSALGAIERSGSPRSPSQNFDATKERRLNQLINSYRRETCPFIGPFFTQIGQAPPPSRFLQWISIRLQICRSLKVSLRGSRCKAV